MPDSSPTVAPFHWTALGDSSGVGVGVGARNSRGYVDRAFARLSAARAGVTLANLCRSGATSAQAVAGQAPRLTAERPHLVSVCIGGNDLWRGVDPVAFGRNLDASAQAVRARAAAGV